MLKAHRGFIALWVLFIAILLRGLFLEYLDLIDPTEARYAAVAQAMIISKNWLTPQIPMPEGLVPYLGKPPLHFWLTAFSYELFGMDELSARLPSFIASLALLFLIYRFVRKTFKSSVAMNSVLIAFSSGLLFFLAGASVVDVTFTAFVSISVAFLYQYITALPGRTETHLYLAAVSLALAFLCKGPLGIVLVFFPLFLWSCATREISWIRKIDWARCAVIFSALSAPWFFLNEIYNPGFIRYFIWNENIARYLFTEYGDKYGTGHVHVYGASWLMLAAAFTPWTFIFIYKVWRLGLREFISWIKSDRHLVFVFCWMLSTPLFFTFVRQLHAMYLLPAVPPAAILTAALFEKQVGQWSLETFRRIAVYALVLTCAGFLAAFAYWNFDLSIHFYLTAASMMAVLWLLKYDQRTTTRVAHISCLTVFFYFFAIIAVTPSVQKRRSSEGILKKITAATSARDEVPDIAVISRHSFSHYWSANAWDTELNGRVNLKYLDAAKVAGSTFNYVLMKGPLSEVPLELLNHFEIALENGPYKILRRKRFRRQVY